MDDITVFYLDNILIYSTNEKDHDDHLRTVLQRLQEYGLYSLAETCRFRVRDVGILGFPIDLDATGIGSDRISTIEDWPTPESVRDVQLLLGPTTLNRRFICNYAQVIAPISTLLKT